MTNSGDAIEVWGDGTAIRSYIYVEDMTEAIYKLMHSALEGPTNIGSPDYVNVEELVMLVADIANKKIRINYVSGPVGVQSRNFSNEKIYRTGWRSRFSLREGMTRTYQWVEEQVRSMQQAGSDDPESRHDAAPEAAFMPSSETAQLRKVPRVTK